MVKIYTIFIFVVMVVHGFVFDGEPIKDPELVHSFRLSVISALFYLPIVGRVMGWW
jgi:hypothetical protein